MIWNASLFVPYAIMSLAYESLFLVIFACFLFIYARLEHADLTDGKFMELGLVSDSRPKESHSRKDNKNNGRISLPDWRRAACLVVFTEMAFFGTGNIASLNSFNTDALR